MGRLWASLGLLAFAYPAYMLAIVNLTLAPSFLTAPSAGFENLQISAFGVFAPFLRTGLTYWTLVLLLSLTSILLLARWSKGLAGLLLVAHGGFLLFTASMVLSRAGFRRWPMAIAALAGLLTVLAGLRWIIHWIPRTSAGWRLPAAGATVTILLALGLHQTGLAIERTRRHATQRVLDSLPKPDPAAPYNPLFFQRGLSFTAECGVRYGSDASRLMLARLPAYGVNSIALIPYGWSQSDPPRIRTAGQRSWESDSGVEILAAEARRLGLKVLLKPHVWRVSPDHLQTEQLRRIWFDEYSRFLDHYARLASKIHADLFCIGVEFGPLTKDEAAWRSLISRVREIYKGPLVYAANFGEEFERISFWDQLDYIGLDNYYPLPDDYSTSEMMQKIEAVHRKLNKPVLFTEAGYSAAEGARRTPWADETQNKLSLDEQARCYEALLNAFYQKPWFYGVYWWKVGTNGYGGPLNNSMTPWEKPAMEIVKRYFLSGLR